MSTAPVRPAAPPPARRRVAMLASLLLALTPVFGSWGQALADTSAPVIEHDPLRMIRLGDLLDVPAVVSDEDGDLSGVFLNLRLPGGDGYTSREMLAADGDTFVGQVTTDTLSIDDTISYFITAIDRAGNEQSEGFSFDPFDVTVVDPDTAIAVADGGGGNRNLWLVVVGVAAAGLVAAVAGGSGGSDDGGASIDTELTLVD